MSLEASVTITACDVSVDNRFDCGRGRSTVLDDRTHRYAQRQRFPIGNRQCGSRSVIGNVLCGYDDLLSSIKQIVVDNRAIEKVAEFWPAGMVTVLGSVTSLLSSTDSWTIHG